MEHGKINNHYDALVIGAGFSGLYQLHRLRDDLGLKTAVVEKADGVGDMVLEPLSGCTLRQRKPRVCLFFSRDLHQKWQWSERYPGHTEIRAYLNYVADTLDLKKTFCSTPQYPAVDLYLKRTFGKLKLTMDRVCLQSGLSRQLAAFPQQTCQTFRGYLALKGSGITQENGHTKEWILQV